MMFSRFLQFYHFEFKPNLLGQITRFFYSSSNIIIGKGFRCDSIPKLTVNNKAMLNIAQHVQFRRNVEIRAHGESSIFISENVRIDRDVRLLATNKAKLSIGKRTAIGLNSVFNGGEDICIGEACLISGFVYLQTSMHNFERNSFIRDQGFTHAPITLNDDVWLGAHVVILPGCALSNGVIVGSNAVVTKSIKNNVIVAGVPANKIGSRT